MPSVGVTTTVGVTPPDEWKHPDDQHMVTRLEKKPLPALAQPLLIQDTQVVSAVPMEKAPGASSSGVYQRMPEGSDALSRNLQEIAGLLDRVGATPADPAEGLAKEYKFFETKFHDEAEPQFEGELDGDDNDNDMVDDSQLENTLCPTNPRWQRDVVIDLETEEATWGPRETSAECYGTREQDLLREARRKGQRTTTYSQRRAWTMDEFGFEGDSQL